MIDSNEVLSEGQELIETFSRLLFEIEEQVRDDGDVDPDRINESFRSIHTLKGLAGLAGLKQLEKFSHEVETSLDSVRLGKLPLDLEIVNLLFEATNTFEKLLGAAADPERARAIDTAPLLAKFEALSKPKSANTKDTLEWLDDSILGVLTEFEEHRLRENIRLGRTMFRVLVDFDLMNLGDGIDVVKANLKQHGEVISFLPSAESSDPDRIELAVFVGSKSSVADITAAVAEQSGIVEILGGGQPSVAEDTAAVAEDTASVAEDTVSVAEDTASVAEDKPPAPDEERKLDDDDSSIRSQSQTVRVDLRRLDLLMNLVGELALVHANLQVQVERWRQAQAIEDFRDLQGQIRTMKRRLGQLQQGILEVRMVPLQGTFDRVRRLVHRTSGALEKEVRLIISGAETELDKKIGEKLSKPLIHMINNAIDHGIEKPAEREALGKPRAGRIELIAYQKGNRVVIELSDDGRGMDWRELRDKAFEKGFITQEEAADIDPARAINLIFLPGFSSKAKASLTAGRGVGMDVVKTEIADLSGMIDVASEPGKGSRFRVTLPSTLAIIQALVIESAGQTFCIQLNSVLESLMVQAGDVQTIEGHEVVSVRGRTLPLMHLSRTFELDSRREAPRRGRDRLYVVVVGLAEARVGLVVDELLGQQDVVIKPVGTALGQIPGIAGATELGDNRTVLLLDVATLVSEAVGGIDAAIAGLAGSGLGGVNVSTKLDR